MTLQDTISLTTDIVDYDDDLNPIEVTEEVSLGKCVIVPNTKASVTKGNDGTEYIYSYEIMFRKKKGMPIPKENDEVHIVKKDGTIDKKCRVVGFVTLKNWVKIWV